MWVFLVIARFHGAISLHGLGGTAGWLAGELDGAEWLLTEAADQSSQGQWCFEIGPGSPWHRNRARRPDRGPTSLLRLS